MEQQFLVKDTDDKLIIKFSEALKAHGIYEGAEFYYTDDNLSLPFFKIPKDYKKEEPNDPDVHYIFVDVNDNSPFSGSEEYTVSGNYAHEHIANVDNAVDLVKKLLSGEIVEVALVLKDRYACYFLTNRGDPKENVNAMASNLEVIKDCLQNASTTVHIHRFPSFAQPYSLVYGGGDTRQIPNTEIYFVSSVFAEHPEFYIVK